MTDPGAVRFHPKHAQRGPLPPLHAERLYDSLGAERPLDESARNLRHYAQSVHPPAVGAILITCADEAEKECSNAFERGFVRYLLPHMKFSSRAPFRMANLGGRYEWGAAAVAEEHYSHAKGADKWKLMVIKLNAHVSVEPGADGPRFGRSKRYEGESTYCGALRALIEGTDRPFGADLADAFTFEGRDRVTALRDPKRVAPEHRQLFAAAASARLQARRAMLDVQDFEPLTPTLWLILPCVTLNKAEHDTEILCGVYTSDRRGEGDHHDEYCGLGDLPERYRLRTDGASLALEDDGLHQPRQARAHRTLVVSEWRREGRQAHEVDARMETALAEARAGRQGKDNHYARPLLKSLLEVSLLFAPVPAALILFGEGLVDIHHAHKAHQLARAAEGDEVARAMLGDVERKIASLSPEQAQHLVELLLQEYGNKR